MGKTVSVRFKDGKVVPSKSKDPAVRAAAESFGEAFLAAPGPVVVGVNPALPEEAREAAWQLLDKSRASGSAVGILRDAKVDYIEPKFIESPAFGQDYVDLKRCSHGKVVCRVCPHDGRPLLPIPEWPEKFSREDFEEKRSAKDALYKAEYEASFPAPKKP